MNQLFEKIRNVLIKPILMWLLSIVGTILFTLSYFFHDGLLSLVLEKKAESSLVWLALGLTTVIFLLLTSLLYFLLYKYKLKPAFTVLWNRKCNPYCPICKTLLSHALDFSSQQSHFECKKCNKNFSATHSSGHIMSIKNVKETFKNNWEI
ncbi:MAG: hypothetical protein IIC75_05445 [Bacteroidetes bacterium]|nr:hypothetical protein [Bacteroidota bacterium]